jgi:hypothetical protein
MTRLVLTRVVLVAIYLAGMVFAVISVDTGDDGWRAALWVVASVLLGAGTGDFRYSYLSFAAIPIAIPFGLPADTSGDPVLPVWTIAPALTMFSAGLIMLAAFLRRFIESRLRRRRIGNAAVSKRAA